MRRLIEWYNLTKMKIALHFLEKCVRKVRKNGDYSLKFAESDYKYDGGNK